MLSERQRLILNAIVDNYIQSAEPVGSRTISKREEINLSSATVRNEMADLEDLGYLEQPHTSAGRVPSTKGYRYYVDNLMEPQSLSEQDVLNLKQLFAERIQHTEKVIEETAIILSQMTNYTSIVLGPEIFDQKLKHLQIVRLNQSQAIVIIVTNTGRVENKLIELPDYISFQEVEKLVNLLNAKLQDTPLWQLRHRLYEEIASEMQRNIQQHQEWLAVMEKTFSEEPKERVYLRGATKIMNQPEFRDVEKVKGIFDLLEKTDQILHLFGSTENGMMIRIGQENEVEAMKQCTIISTTYTLDGKPVGTVGILGPTRMDYKKVISVLNFLAEGLSRALTEGRNRN